MLDPVTIDAYISVLEEELVLATGCTEPIALAYCAALVRKVLGAVPEKVLVEVSGNIIKNVKSVVVPNTGKQKGIRTAVAAGIVAGDPEGKLQVISSVPPQAHAAIGDYAANTPMDIVCMQTPFQLDIRLTGTAGADSATVRITKTHANVVHVERNGEVLHHRELVQEPMAVEADRSFLSVAGILEFAESVDVSRVADVLDRQINYNTAIAEAGLRGGLGCQHRLRPAEGVPGGYQNRGQGLGGGRQRCPDERL